MSVEALRVDDAESGVLLRCELGADIRQVLTTARSSPAPVGYVVRNVEIGAFTALRDLVVDRHAKHPAKSLASILLGRQRIPAVRAGYSVPGQLVRGVRALLRRASEAGDLNAFIVGVDDPVFERLWAGAGGGDSGSGRAAPPTRREAATRGPSGGRARLLELLPTLAVPETLARAFVGESDEADLVRQLVLRAAEHDEPVLVLGDTGTGKEVVARQIHAQSGRRHHAFVPVNCGAIPAELFESELFGYEPGSHSQAKGRKLGLWRVATKGTLFLDEIADLRPAHQVKILRALEENRILPVGGTEEVAVDARVVAATNRDVFALVRGGEFREDLYYRLRAFLIRTPALRDHPADIPLLAEFFWQRITGEAGAGLPAEILAELVTYRWPGNARELRTVLSSLHALFGRSNLSLDHLRAVLEFEGQARGSGGQAGLQNERPVDGHRIECVYHLRRVDETLRALAVSLRPVVEECRRDTAVVERARRDALRRLQELDLLTRTPLLFGSDATFTAVDRLRDGGLEICDLMRSDLEAANRLWERRLGADLQAAMSALFEQVNRFAEPD